MVPDRIEREIVIDAPLEVVWAVITEPRHISAWFSDSVELDLRPGGALALHWKDHGTVHGRVEHVEPPHLFSFRWVVDGHGSGVGGGHTTLVEFRLEAEGDVTRLTVVESGFSVVAGSEQDNQGRFDGHSEGWTKELGELVDFIREGGGR
jgi:uncharacterized protein YndB with AHSA1/START domain